mmetsp:Transcript_2211/g.4993  ORF Transcript_2211/g.4993 Transcript_2211/m.4993 type:complete len:472 (+) Transcript_2211:44-1459(+)
MDPLLEIRELSSPRDGHKPQRRVVVEPSPAAHGEDDDDDERSNQTDVSVAKTPPSTIRKRDMQPSPSYDSTTPTKKRKYSTVNVAKISNLPVTMNSIGFCSFVEKKLRFFHGVNVEICACRRLPPTDDKLSVLLSFENDNHCELALSLNEVKYMDRVIYATLDDDSAKTSEKLKEECRMDNKMDQKLDYITMKKLLEEVQHDVWCYRKQLDSERSYTRRLEANIDDLRRENDDLLRRSHDTQKMEIELDNIRRENDILRRRSHDVVAMKAGLHDLRCENDDLRRRYHASKRLEDELNDLRRENDDLRRRYHVASPAEYDHRGYGYGNVRDENRMANLRWQLGEMAHEKEALIRDTAILKEEISNLKSVSLNGGIKQDAALQSPYPSVNTDGELQRRLDEALSQNKHLNSILEHTKQKVKDFKTERESKDKTISDLQLEKDSMEEEMEQMKMNHAMELGFAGGEAGSDEGEE